MKCAIHDGSLREFICVYIESRLMEELKIVESFIQGCVLPLVDDRRGWYVKPTPRLSEMNVAVVSPSTRNQFVMLGNSNGTRSARLNILCFVSQ